MKLAKVALFACAVALNLPSLASAVVINGDTTGGPVYTRPLQGLGSLSAAGVDVRYEVTAFTVGSAGNYDFTATAGYDNFLTLYSGGFDPANSLTNALIANDDLGTIGISGFSKSLLTGVSYFVVATGFDPASFGAYTLTIDGPGTVNVAGVPEPAAWMLMIAGFGMVGSAMRRRGNVVVRSIA